MPRAVATSRAAKRSEPPASRRQQDDRRTRSTGVRVPAAVLVLLTLLAYVPAMQGGFVWDDDDYVTANRTLRTVDGLGRIWAEPGAVPQYYPLTFTSLWLEYRLWGLSPTGYHVTNVLLHAVG